MVEVAPSEKPFCQKLIKIDILLSHVNLHKMSIMTHLSEQKNFPTNTCKTNSEKWQPRRQNRPESGKPKTDILENRPFGLGFPQGSILHPISFFTKFSPQKLRFPEICDRSQKTQKKWFFKNIIGQEEIVSHSSDFSTRWLWLALKQTFKNVRCLFQPQN
jgi:hypothetical protein